MKRVYQTKYGIGGNCMAACVASILECDIDEVPVGIASGIEQNRQLNEWLAGRGIHYFECEIKALVKGTFEDVVCLFTVPSETPEVAAAGFTHAVVGKWNTCGCPVLLHDPKPTADQTRVIQPTLMGIFLRRDLAFGKVAA